MVKYLIVVGIMAAASASAEGLEDWGTSGQWKILVDPSSGNGCLAERSFDDGTRVQIGAVPARDGGFFAAYNPSWTDIEDGEDGTVKFDFGDAMFAGDVKGRIDRDEPGGYAFFDNPNFVSEFGKRNTVKVSGDRGRLVEINLAGSKKAIDAVLDCQSKQPEAQTD